jgi:predicted Ser/Thr protein kinase
MGRRKALNGLLRFTEAPLAVSAEHLKSFREQTIIKFRIAAPFT